MSEYYRVLVVDDSAVMRTTLKRILTREHKITRIDEASDGAEALSKVKENDYDMIILDLDMPVMDGIEFIKRAKIHSKAQVVVTATADNLKSMKVQKALFFGAADVIEVPEESVNVSIDWSRSNDILRMVNNTLIAC
jgi:chemotaxis response regulator CheB